MTTTQKEAREAIYQVFVDAWTASGAASDGLPYTFDNEDFKQPKTPWARFSVRHTASTQETLGKVGNRRFARFGSAFTQIYTDTDSGTSDVDDLVQVVREAFEGVRLVGTTVRFMDVIVRETGVDGKWFQTVIEAEFQYDETR